MGIDEAFCIFETPPCLRPKSEFSELGENECKQSNFFLYVLAIPKNILVQAPYNYAGKADKFYFNVEVGCNCSMPLGVITLFAHSHLAR